MFNYLKKIIKLGLQTIHKSGPLKVCHSGTNLIALLFLLLGDGKETHFQDDIEDWSSVDLRWLFCKRLSNVQDIVVSNCI